jgi:hypothetical protein
LRHSGFILPTLAQTDGEHQEVVCNKVRQVGGHQIPLETRPADQASAALNDLKNGGKVRGRVVPHHHYRASSRDFRVPI